MSTGHLTQMDHLESLAPVNATQWDDLSLYLTNDLVSDDEHRRYLVDESPWQRRDHVIAIVLVVIGTAIAIGCWFGVANQVSFAAQEGWLVGSILGATLSGLGAAGWLTAGFIDVRRGQRDVTRDLRLVMGVPAAGTAAGTEAQTPALVLSASIGDPAVRLVSGPKMRRVHAAGCDLVRGKQTFDLSPDEASLRGLRSCGMCLT